MNTVLDILQRHPDWTIQFNKEERVPHALVIVFRVTTERVNHHQLERVVSSKCVQQYRYPGGPIAKELIRMEREFENREN